MARPKKPIPDKSIPVRFSLPLLAQIKEVAQIMGESEQEVIRLCTRIGLEQLGRINYNTAKAIVDAVERQRLEDLEAAASDGLMAAEAPGKYQAGKKKSQAQ